MREHKFKVWDKEKKRMSNPVPIFSPVVTWNDGDIDMPTDFALAKERFIFLEFTGRHDKNGTEIYEGDLIRATTGLSYPIAFVNGSFSLIVDNNRLPAHLWPCHLWEVSGNMFESEVNVVEDENKIEKILKRFGGKRVEHEPTSYGVYYWHFPNGDEIMEDHLDFYQEEYCIKNLFPLAMQNDLRIEVFVDPIDKGSKKVDYTVCVFKNDGTRYFEWSADGIDFCKTVVDAVYHYITGPELGLE